MNCIFKFVKTIRPLIKDNQSIQKIYSILQTYDGQDLYDFYSLPKVGEYNKQLINVTKDTDLFQIYMINWGKNSKSLIHNHPSNGCLMKILSGSLIEKSYIPMNNKQGISNLSQLKYNKTTFLYKGDITYIDNSLRYHQIINHTNHPSFSLHIYSPPNFKMNTFHE
tara:strand:+ start:150 stop:647 length:498 start_codon:yes stop_codon:yes gene_type:complete